MMSLQLAPSLSLSSLDPDETVEIGPRLYFNGFPKSGLHLAVLMGGYLALPWVQKYKADDSDEIKERDMRWTGTFEPAWSNKWRDLEYLKIKLVHQPEGSWMKGHVGYTPELAELIRANGQAFAIVYRDLRDVAVSATYHIEDKRERDADGLALVHPGKEEYWELPSHEARLMAVICGLNDWPGLFERWELYAPWLDVEWVFPIRFELMRSHPRWQADLFIRWALQHTLEQNKIQIQLTEEDYAPALRNTLKIMADPTNSYTFRKGKAGEWRHEFTPAIKNAFKERAGDWLIRLGYEKGNDW